MDQNNFLWFMKNYENIDILEYMNSKYVNATCMEILIYKKDIDFDTANRLVGRSLCIIEDHYIIRALLDKMGYLEELDAILLAPTWSQHNILEELFKFIWKKNWLSFFIYRDYLESYRKYATPNLFKKITRYLMSDHDFVNTEEYLYYSKNNSWYEHYGKEKRPKKVFYNIDYTSSDDFFYVLRYDEPDSYSIIKRFVSENPEFLTLLVPQVPLIYYIKCGGTNKKVIDLLTTPITKSLKETWNYKDRGLSGSNYAYELFAENKNLESPLSPLELVDEKHHFGPDIYNTQVLYCLKKVIEKWNE